MYKWKMWFQIERAPAYSLLLDPKLELLKAGEPRSLALGRSRLPSRRTSRCLHVSKTKINSIILQFWLGTYQDVDFLVVNPGTPDGQKPGGNNPGWTSSSRCKLDLEAGLCHKVSVPVFIGFDLE